ncbi:MAG: hypothetical protein K2W95_26815 [Candidatus Obscuribacterales bacterium]|nr:hypothetical protein [Candidatus Obscuribacterales bacterium]
MSTSGNTHRGHGPGASAVMDKPEPSAPRNTLSQGQTRPKLKRPSNQVMVLLIAGAIFTILISLPWILDTVQDEKGQKKTESAQTASNTSTPVPSQFASSAVGVDSRFGIPRAAQAYPNSMSPPQSPMAAPALPTQHSYQAIPMPMRPFAMPQHASAEAGQRPSPVQHFVPMGRSIDSVSPQSEGEDDAHAARHPGAYAVDAAPVAAGVSQAPRYGAAPKPFSAPFESEGKRLPSSIQAPAEAMARLLSGQDVPMESYYAAIYGNGAVSPESGLVDHPAISPAAPPNAVQHPQQQQPSHGRTQRQPGGVYERHQMFVMR